MPTFLQPIELPKRCFLHEVLFWVAFQRLPIASYTLDGKEIRETDEIGGYAVEVFDPTLEEDETAQLFLAADKLRKNLEPSDYKHVALGLIFLKYISNAFEAKRTALLAEPEALHGR
jgi:hypothetical protein